MPNCPSLNCSDALATPPPLQPNPDISGIGVLVGFFATAYIAWSLLVIHYVLVFDPAKACLTDELTHANPIDEKILGFVAKYITRPQKMWEKALEKMVLMMSDQQMITGIALLASAFMQLNCGISAYHWQMTIYLVWFSSFTHLATLTFLRQYLHENSPMRWWRLFFMTALLALLVAALIPTGNDDWLPSNEPGKTGMPALCLFRYPPHEGLAARITMLFSVFFLCVSYTVRAIKLFEWSSKYSRLYLRTKPGDLVKSHLEKLYSGVQSTKTRKWIICIPYYVILSVFLVVRSWLDLLESMFWEVTWLLIALLWGSLRLFSTRNVTIEQDANILDENFWGFGQCLAAAMLVLLLFCGIENYLETIQTKQSERSDGPDPSVLTSDIGTPSAPDISGTRESDHGASTSRKIPTVETKASEDSDISDQALDSTEVDEPLQGVTRTTNNLSLEERSIETPSHRCPSNRDSESGIELAEPTQAIPSGIESTTELQASPPHSRNFYDDKWYLALAGFNCCQALLLSGGILSGAYNAKGGFKGIYGSARDAGAMFLNTIEWVTFFAPVASFIFTFPHVGLKEIHFERPVCRHIFLLSRAKSILPYASAFAAASFSVFHSRPSVLPISVLPFGDRIGFLWVYSSFGITYGIWYWIVTRKMKREGRSS